MDLSLIRRHFCLIIKASEAMDLCVARFIDGNTYKHSKYFWAKSQMFLFYLTSVALDSLSENVTISKVQIL